MLLQHFPDNIGSIYLLVIALYAHITVCLIEA